MTSSNKPLFSHDITTNDFAEGTTSNMTSSTQFTDQKLVATILCIFLLLCATYLLIALSFFEYQTRLRQNSKSKTFCRNLTKEERFRVLCLCSVIFMQLRYALELVEIFQNEFTFSPCAWTRPTKMFMLTGSAVCTYLILWLRQRNFYNTPRLKHISNNVTRTCSFFVIVFMAASASIPVILYLSTRSYARSMYFGCVDTFPTVWHWLPGLLYYILVLLFQSMLISLFFYPPWKHRHSSLVEHKDLMQMIKRVRNAATVAVVTTSVSGLLSLVLLNTPTIQESDELLHILLDFDILVNLLSVIIAFKNWRARLAPFLIR